MSGNSTHSLRWRFVMDLETRPDMEPAQATAFIDRLRDHAGRAGVRLACVGGPTRWDCRLEPMTVDEGMALAEWLTNQPEVVTYRLGPSELSTTLSGQSGI